MLDYNRLMEKRNFVRDNVSKLDNIILDKYRENFSVDFTHNSTAIEGNTLTLLETKMLIEDNLSIGSKELREIYEVVNHNKAWNYVKGLIDDNKSLDEEVVKEIHSLLMDNIMVGGIYRTVEVMITGAKHIPPKSTDAYYELKDFYTSLNDGNYNDLDIAAYAHAEFVKIHPFVDGNGRTSRIIMNFQLLKNGFLPVSIKKEERLRYYEALDEYAINGNLDSFKEIVYELEDKELDFYIKAIGDSAK